MKKFFQKITNRTGVLGELLSFFWKNKMWWMLPMIIVIILVGLLLFAANASPLAPFVYPFL